MNIIRTFKWKCYQFLVLVHVGSLLTPLYRKSNIIIIQLNKKPQIVSPYIENGKSHTQYAVILHKDNFIRNRKKNNFIRIGLKNKRPTYNKPEVPILWQHSASCFCGGIPIGIIIFFLEDILKNIQTMLYIF